VFNQLVLGLLDLESTADFTLRRMSNIDLGTTTWIGDGDTQWDVLPVNTFDGLGWHENTTCGASIPVVAEIESITNTCVGSEINLFLHLMVVLLLIHTLGILEMVMIQQQL
jgi:hypothetical protein